MLLDEERLAQIPLTQIDTEIDILEKALQLYLKTKQRRVRLEQIQSLIDLNEDEFQGILRCLPQPVVALSYEKEPEKIPE